MVRKATKAYLKPILGCFTAEWRASLSYRKHEHEQIEAIIQAHKGHPDYLVKEKRGYLKPARDGEVLRFNSVTIQYIGDIV
jgi:hypothetical protein